MDIRWWCGHGAVSGADVAIGVRNSAGPAGPASTAQSWRTGRHPATDPFSYQEF